MLRYISPSHNQLKLNNVFNEEYYAKLMLRVWARGTLSKDENMKPKPSSWIIMSSINRFRGKTNQSQISVLFEFKAHNQFENVKMVKTLCLFQKNSTPIEIGSQ